jgi:hypothetical protein
MINWAVAITLFLIAALCGCYLFGADVVVVKVLAVLLGISALVAGIGFIRKET